MFLSTRSGTHVINRVGPHGYPIDYIVLRRYLTQLLDKLPPWLCAWYIRKMYLDPKFDCKLYPVEPNNHVLAKDPVFCDHFSSRLLSGAVQQKKDVTRFTEDGVVFESEDQVTKVDTVIMATGYDWKFPFLEDGIIVQEKDGRINLFKCMWPPHLKHQTFGVVGFVLPYGPGFPVGELQCRYLTQVFAGKCKLPSVEVMLKDIEERHAKNKMRYVPNNKNSLRVDFVQYCDDLASEIGVAPNFLKIFLTDIRLFWKLVFGPSVSYQYRLEGPHKWEGARNAIMTVDERLHFPLLKEKTHSYLSWLNMTKEWLYCVVGLLGYKSNNKKKLM